MPELVYVMDAFSKGLLFVGSSRVVALAALLARSFAVSRPLPNAIKIITKQAGQKLGLRIPTAVPRGADREGPGTSCVCPCRVPAARRKRDFETDAGRDLCRGTNSGSCTLIFQRPSSVPCVSSLIIMSTPTPPAGLDVSPPIHPPQILLAEQAPPRDSESLTASSSQQASLLTINKTANPKAIPAFSTLVFGQTFTDHMLMCRWSATTGWAAPSIEPYGPLSLDPSATVLHYAPTLFEGMKAYKDKSGNARLFRPDMNMARLQRGCARLGFPEFDSAQLTALIRKLVALDEQWIPTDPGCSLYIRPTMIGTRASLGVGPSDEILLFVIASPVGPYYASGWKPISLLSSTKDVRAWPGGTGSHKLGANYAGS